jgi:hypothetical protein
MREHAEVTGTGPARSLARIDIGDLLRLAELAAEVEAGLFARRPHGAGRYAGRLICRALCQGAVLHYIDGKTGVKDFDVWSFYAELQDGPFPYRWRGTADYGPSKFGRHPADLPSFVGRRVDMLGRSLNMPADAEPTTALAGKHALDLLSSETDHGFSSRNFAAAEGSMMLDQICSSGATARCGMA